MFVRNGEKLGSVYVDDPNDPPKKAAKKAPAKKAETKDETSVDDSFKSALDSPEEESNEPPRNASTEEWAKFLKDEGIDHPEDAGRDEMIRLYDER